MSGGSYGYAFGRVRDVADDRRLTEGSEPRQRLARHLGLVADAMRAVEWVDSCDYGPGDEDEAIAAMFADAGGDEAVEDRARTLLEAYPESLWPPLTDAEMAAIPGDLRSRLYSDAARRVLRQVLGLAEATATARAGWRMVAETTAQSGAVWLLEQPITGELFADLAAAATGSARVEYVAADTVSYWAWSAMTDEHFVMSSRSTLGEAQAAAEEWLAERDALPGGAR